MVRTMTKRLVEDRLCLSISALGVCLCLFDPPTLAPAIEPLHFSNIEKSYI